MTQSVNTWDNWNQKIIEEFRANDGKVGGQFERATLLLLTTTGAKSGQARTLPLAYFADAGHIYIVASKAGAPSNPDWYYNLLAHPDVTVEIGSETFEATATVLEREERDTVFAKIAAMAPGFGEYQTKTSRVIPVVELVRKAR